MGKPDYPECGSNMRIMWHTCQETGTSVEEDKCEGPVTIVPFLGIELDTVVLEICLPADKLQQLRKQVHDWRGKKAATKRELLTLIRSLQHARKTVRPGRSFMQRLIELSKLANRLDNHLQLNLSARSDIEWWHQFAADWNGASMLINACEARQSSFYSRIRCFQQVGFSGSPWFQLQWSSALGGSHITLKDFIPIVLAGAVWGEQWTGKTVLPQCDNVAVAVIINSGSSKDADVMHLMRCLAFPAAKFNFVIVSRHIRGVDNDLTDALLREKVNYFRSHHPQAQPHPSEISPELLDLVVAEKPDWTSTSWNQSVEFYRMC